MNVTITFGWWLIPLAGTIAAYTWAAMKSEPGHGDYSISSGIFFYPLATIAALASWLIWALLT